MIEYYYVNQNTSATRQMDGSFVSHEFNCVPLVSFGGTGSQPRALLDVNVSRESYVPLSEASTVLSNMDLGLSIEKR